MPVWAGRSMWRGLLDIDDMKILEEGKLPDFSQEEIEAFSSLNARGLVCKCGCNGCTEDSKEETDVG